jgi:hypothetical protein
MVASLRSEKIEVKLFPDCHPLRLCDHAESVLLRALQQEIRRHDFNYFIYNHHQSRKAGEACLAVRHT